MSHTIRTAAQAAAELQRQDWGTLNWLASGALTGSALTLGRVVIRKGQSNPRHCHRTCEEALYLLAGRLRHSVGDHSVVLEPGDTLVIPAGVMHNALSLGDQDADMIVVYSSGQRDFVLEG
ncbi:MAG: cupin domain-containing protein [Phycisphaeraceae bacterium]